MKRFLGLLFFRNAPSRQAMGGLILAVCGSWLWFSCFHFLFIAGVVSLPWWVMVSDFPLYSAEWWVFLVGEAAILLYGLAMLATALAFFTRTVFREGKLRYLWYWPAILLTGGAGLGGVVLTLRHMSHYVVILISYVGDESDADAAVPVLENLWIVTLSSLLFLGIAVLLLARMLTVAENRPLRFAFDRASRLLLSLFALEYLVALALAVGASCATARTEEKLAKRFDRPMTAEGVAAYYARFGTPDREFWPKMKDLCRRLPDVLPCGTPWNLELPDRPEPEPLQAFERFARENAEVLAVLEEGIDRVPPPLPLDFSPGNLSLNHFPHLAVLRSLCRLQKSRIIAAIARGDRAAALRAYARMRNCTVSAEHTPPLIGSIIWIALESVRLDSMEKLLASKLLSEEDLDAFAADLDALLPRIAENRRQMLYSEAVWGNDLFYGLETGRLKMPGRTVPTLPFGSYRLFVPQFWFHAALDRGAFLRLFDPDEPADTEEKMPAGGFFSAMLAPSTKAVEQRFHIFADRVRAMQVLLRLVRYRYRHGAFPERVEDLPRDSYGNEMRCREGIVEVTEKIWRKEEDSWVPDTVLRQRRALQVWSIGPNGIDDDGRDRSFLQPPKRDDVRALLELE